MSRSPWSKCCLPHPTRTGTPALLRPQLLTLGRWGFPPDAAVLSRRYTRLDDASLRIAVALRLGTPICAPHKCICGVDVDKSGVHGLSCRKSAGRHVRHSALNDLVKRALTSAEVPSRLEPSSLSRSYGKQPDGLTMMPWKQGRCMVWVVTCPDTLATSHLNRAITSPGAVAAIAEQGQQTSEVRRDQPDLHLRPDRG